MSLFLQLQGAQRDNRVVRINGYKDDKGEVLDIDVIILPEEGYKNLVRDSLKVLQNTEKRKAIIQQLEKEGYSDVVTAVFEQMASFERTIAGQQVPRSFTEKLKKHGPGVFSSEDKPAAPILIGMKKVRELRVGSSQIKAAKSLPVKSALTQKLPLADYHGRLNLYPGKYESIQFL